MTVALDAPPTSLGATHPPGRTFDRVFRIVALVAGSLVLVILALIAVTMIVKAWPAFTDQGLSYFTSDVWDPQSNQFGTLAFAFGTIVVSAIAVVIAVPVSLGIALFTTEVAPKWLRTPITYVIDLLAAVPSVVYGLWGILVLAPVLPGFYADVHDIVAPIPVLNTLFSGDPVSGRSFMTAGLILAIMITPIVTAVARETFTTVPQSLKDAAHALGATRWETIRASVLPHSRSGVMAGVLLGLGRALGETIAVALVIGSSPQISAKLFSSGDALAAVIANQFGEATGGTYRAALIGMAVVLFVLTLVVGVIARGVLARAERDTGGYV